MKNFLTYGPTVLFSVQNSPLIIGLCIGITISLVQTPFLQINCVQQDVVAADGMRLSNIRDLRSNPDKEADEDFEPSLHLDENVEMNKNGDDKQTNKLIRPRYYSTELGMRDKVLVSVLSTKQSIGTLGVAINKTLNHYVDKLIFFLDGTGTKKFGLNIPIVGFRESKPSIKIFRVLSYISENYLSDYDYFFFATENTYINGKHLLSLLQQVSISLNVHMGKLTEDDESLYCSLDGGIILSQSILEVVGKKLAWCTKHSFSESDSDNLGRCILHASNLPCKSRYQFQHFSSYNLPDNTDVSAHLQIVGSSSVVKEAVTVTNINTSLDMFKLHVYYLQEFVVQTKDEILVLREKIKSTMEASTLNIPLTWPVGSPNPYVPPSRFDLITWETFNATHLFMPNDFENIKPLTGVNLLDIMSVVNASIAYIQANSVEYLQYENMRYGHRKFDPTRGMDYLLSLTFKDPLNEIIHKRIEAFRGLTLPEIIPMPYVTENIRLTILLFVEKADVGDVTTLLTSLESAGNVEHLSISLCFLYAQGESYISKNDPFKSLKDLATQLSKKQYRKESRVIYTHLVMPNGRPSDFALIDLAVKKLPGDSLVLVTEKRASFGLSFLNRVRMNTIKNYQIFSPIPFILYHPDAIENEVSYSKKEVNKNNGHFDKYYFNQISFYAEDYIEARKAISKSIPLINFESDLKKDFQPSMSVYEMFLAVSNLHVLRGVEPDLILSYEPIQCTASNPLKESKKFDFCEIRQGLSIGLKTTLSKMVINYEKSKEEKLHLF